MINEFSKIMSAMSDKELVNVVTVNRDSYQSLAIEAAKSEISNRNLDQKEFETFRVELSSEKEEKSTIEETVLQRRVNNYLQTISCIIDLVTIILIVLLLSYLLDYLTPYVGEQTINQLMYVIIIPPYFLYFIILDLNFQKTLGKYVTRTKVVNRAGERCSLGQIAGRTVYRVLPLFFMGPFRRSKLNLFDFLDSFTGTLIISDNNKNKG